MVAAAAALLSEGRMLNKSEVSSVLGKARQGRALSEISKYTISFESLMRNLVEKVDSVARRVDGVEVQLREEVSQVNKKVEILADNIQGFSTEKKASEKAALDEYRQKLKVKEILRKQQAPERIEPDVEEKQRNERARELWHWAFDQIRYKRMMQRIDLRGMRIQARHSIGHRLGSVENTLDNILYKLDNLQGGTGKGDSLLKDQIRSLDKRFEILRQQVTSCVNEQTEANQWCAQYEKVLDQIKNDCTGLTKAVATLENKDNTDASTVESVQKEESQLQMQQAVQLLQALADQASSSESAKLEAFAKAFLEDKYSDDTTLLEEIKQSTSSSLPFEKAAWLLFDLLQHTPHELDASFEHDLKVAYDTLMAITRHLTNPGAISVRTSEIEHRLAIESSSLEARLDEITANDSLHNELSQLQANLTDTFLLIKDREQAQEAALMGLVNDALSNQIVPSHEMTDAISVTPQVLSDTPKSQESSSMRPPTLQAEAVLASDDSHSSSEPVFSDGMISNSAFLAPDSSDTEAAAFETASVQPETQDVSSTQPQAQVISRTESETQKVLNNQPQRQRTFLFDPPARKVSTIKRPPQGVLRVQRQPQAAPVVQRQTQGASSVQLQVQEISNNYCQSQGAATIQAQVKEASNDQRQIQAASSASVVCQLHEVSSDQARLQAPANNQHQVQLASSIESQPHQASSDQARLHEAANNQSQILATSIVQGHAQVKEASSQLQVQVASIIGSPSHNASSNQRRFKETSKNQDQILGISIGEGQGQMTEASQNNQREIEVTSSLGLQPDEVSRNRRQLQEASSNEGQTLGISILQGQGKGQVQEAVHGQYQTQLASKLQGRIQEGLSNQGQVQEAVHGQYQTQLASKLQGRIQEGPSSQGQVQEAVHGQYQTQLASKLQGRIQEGLSNQGHVQDASNTQRRIHRAPCAEPTIMIESAIDAVTFDNKHFSKLKEMQASIELFREQLADLRNSVSREELEYILSAKADKKDIQKLATALTNHGNDLRVKDDQSAFVSTARCLSCHNPLKLPNGRMTTSNVPTSTEASVPEVPPSYILQHTDESKNPNYFHPAKSSHAAIPIPTTIRSVQHISVGSRRYPPLPRSQDRVLAAFASSTQGEAEEPTRTVNDFISNTDVATQ